MKRFLIWSMTKKHVEDNTIGAHFLTLIGQGTYSLLETLAFSGKPVVLPCATLRELLILNHVKCTDFECRERVKFHKVIHRDTNNPNTLLSYPNSMRAQGFKDNDCLSSHKSGYRGEHGFGKCLSCSKFCSRNSCVF